MVFAWRGRCADIMAEFLPAAFGVCANRKMLLCLNSSLELGGVQQRESLALAFILTKLLHFAD